MGLRCLRTWRDEATLPNVELNTTRFYFILFYFILFYFMSFLSRIRYVIQSDGIYLHTADGKKEESRNWAVAGQGGEWGKKERAIEGVNVQPKWRKVSRAQGSIGKKLHGDLRAYSRSLQED